MGRVEKQSGRAPNWILTTPELSAVLLGQDQWEEEQPMHKGNLGNKKVFSHPSCLEGQILMGHKGDLYTSGYFYCPFVQLILLPKVPESMQERRLRARYGKAMPFPEFYGRIQVHGYSPKEKEVQEDGN